jgi:DNA-3-methyladenine glycosylase I
MDINKRCKWCHSDPIYIKYHDEEWGVPIFNDEKLFEILILETFQAGLSWITVLKKRENFKIAFDNFNAHKISKYSSKKLNELQNNKSIIRNKLKIYATKNNAISFLKIQKKYGSFSKFIWKYTNYKPILNHYKYVTDIPSKTSMSCKISNDLKRYNFKFVGPKIIYAYMQAVGIVNDHTTNCFKYEQK